MSAWVPRVLLGVGVGRAGRVDLSRSSVGEGGPQAAEVGGVNEVQGLLGGIAQEGADLGPDDADLRITVFNDLQCTTCADFELDTIDPLIEEYARTGEAQFEFRHFSLAPNDTTLAAIAADAAGVQDRQWQYLDTFLRNQDLARTRGVDDEFLREIAEAVPAARRRSVGGRTSTIRPARTSSARTRCSPPSLKLPAEPAVVVEGPGGQQQLDRHADERRDRGRDRRRAGLAPDATTQSSPTMLAQRRVEQQEARSGPRPSIQSSGSVGESSSSRLPR